MKEYFILQYKMTNRRLKDFGIKPVFGYLLIFAAFPTLSLFLFYQTKFAPYIYLFISLSLTSQLSETGRNDFLKLCFKNAHYKLVRIIENLLSSIPFLLFLIYKQFFIGSIILFILSLIFGLSNLKTSLNYTIPTPFYKKPFEFTVGFRNTFYLFLIAYLLTFIAITVDNFNLGIFSLLLVFLVTLTFYLKPENEYFVWSFALTPQQFIMGKIKTSLLFTSIISIPVVVTLCLFYYENIDAIIGFFIIGCAFIIMIVSAKYSAYPEEMNLPEGIILVLCISVPPLLLLFTPYFFLKAKNKLQRYLI